MNEFGGDVAHVYVRKHMHMLPMIENHAIPYIINWAKMKRWSKMKETHEQKAAEMRRE